ncbi:hypothetical protein Syun_016407 [Stephania yunnanensis]|uniref:Argonaute linker 1 domain-containing protein n=1 Tax=Stephania yunnanensis TaxID=152371 RepID=A0AAP0J5X6_9MAGN
MSHRGGRGGGGGGRGGRGRGRGGGRGGGAMEAGSSSSAAAEVEALSAEVERSLVVEEKAPPVSTKAPPVSTKGLGFPARPGPGTVGTRCLVKANHFLVNVRDKDLHHYDVSFMLSLKVSLVSFLSLRSASVVFPLWVLELLLSLLMMIRAQGFPSFDCRVHFDMGFSQRSFRFHFCFGLKKRSQESVAITPEVISRGVNRTILNQLIKDYGQKHLGNLLPAYDGRKSLYTAGPLPFTSKEFTVKLVNEDGQSTRRERTFKVAIKFAARADLHHLRQFLSGRQMDSAHDTIQVLDVVLRESPSKSCVVVGRSFFSEIYGPRNAVGEGLECWRGYYQSLRPTQMGLSLNIGRDPVNELSAK